MPDAGFWIPVVAGIDRQVLILTAVDKAKRSILDSDAESIFVFRICQQHHILLEEETSFIIHFCEFDAMFE